MTIMKRFTLAACCATALFLTSEPTIAGSLYLPTNLSPEIESRIARLFVQANMPVIKRPISIKQVQLALDNLGSKDPDLSASIRRYLERYSSRAGVTHASIATYASNEGYHTLPNSRGTESDSQYEASALAYVALNDWALLNVGGYITDRENRKDEFPEGTFLSFGPDQMQVDIGYRPHWLGPFQESDMLLSTNAPALPGITLSNILPFNFLGISYELFLAEMSESDLIRSQQDRDTRNTGNPRLFGLHLSFQPVDGFAIGFNRLMQYGGADRDDSLSSLSQAFFNAKENDNVGIKGRDFGNQLSSITTSYTFTGRFPAAIYMEYAGEDTSYSSEYHLGNTALMFGLHLPKLTRSLDFSYEYAEWQNAWYTNGNYGDGLREYEIPMGHWGANYRVFKDAVGAKAETAKLIWDIRNGHSLTFKWRQLENKYYASRDYVPAKEGSLEYALASGPFIMGATVTTGTTVFDENYSSLSGFFRW
ncbi:capsule assembly Wzi family protein [Teredinibacter turnerae]|uniref:capsule assembly Wzi family protein n=1 Tax=Teredinibacter turnerae TaxID=2426 RepID=UPI00039E0D79|nr:capsule assembly Wzi family protein [Teredinibacter turnerae]